MDAKIILLELILYLTKQEKLEILKCEKISKTDSVDLLKIKTKIETYREIMEYLRLSYPKHTDEE